MAKIDDSVKKKVPELRFKGFTDDWEERKFDECFNFPVSTNSLSRALLNYDEGDIKSVHYGDILIKYPAILNIKNDKIPYITGGKLEKYKSSLLENGDLIFADAAEDETVGKAVEVNGLTEENLVAGLHTIVARPKDKKAEFFLGYYINSNTYHRQLLRLIQGSKVSSISKGNLQKTLVSFPKDLEEQQKIGAFFKKIDDTIALHQRKLDLLKEQKKGYLQKMFPKNGSKIPELRFQGFSGDWAERKLKDISFFIDGNYGAKYPKDSEFMDSGIPFFTSAVIGKNGIFNRANVKYISKDKNNELTKAQSYGGDLVLTNRGASMGAISEIPLDFDQVNIGPQLTRITADKNNNNLFLLALLKTPYYSRKLISMNAGSAMNFVGLDTLGKFSLLAPNLREQQKIGAFFKQLDDTIALHQRKLDLLKEQKKGFLQKMFI